MKIFKYIETGYEEWEFNNISIIKAETMEQAKEILIYRSEYDEYNGKLSEVKFDSDGIDQIV